jgi:hypothetical protein
MWNKMDWEKDMKNRMMNELKEGYLWYFFLEWNGEKKWNDAESGIHNDEIYII